MTELRRIGYIGHHGSTELFMAIHRELATLRVAHPDPGVITFNRYWGRYVRRLFPKAELAFWPTSVDWKRLQRMPVSVLSAEQASAFERAWRIDKLLRHHRRESVMALWKESLKRCDDWLARCRPSVVISEIIQSLPCYALYSRCRSAGIPFVQLATSRLPGRFSVFLDESGVPWGLDMKRAPSEAALQAADAFISSLEAPQYQGPTYMKRFRRKLSWLKSSDLLKTWQYMSEQFQGGLIEPTAPGFWHPFTSRWQAKRAQSAFRRSKAYKGLDQVKALGGHKVLFPLHVTPEASTDVWAPRFADMGETVRRLSAALPDGWTLLVKEHPSAVYLQRNADEAASLKSMPRTLLVSPYVSNAELLAQSEAIVVINSTLGLEAMARGRMVITLGRPFYDASENTVPCETPEALRQAISEARSRACDPERTRRFLAAYYDCTAEGIPNNPHIDATSGVHENIVVIARSLAQTFLNPRHRLSVYAVNE